jgi:WD40 repeat protein
MRQSDKASPRTMLIPILLCSLIGMSLASVAVAQEAPRTELVPKIGHQGSATSLTFSPDGARILSVSQDGIKLWDVATGALLRTLSDGGSPAAFTPDGKQLLSYYKKDQNLTLRDVRTGTIVRSFAKKQTGLYEDVGFSPDGTRLLSISKDRKLKLWDVATGALLRTFAWEVSSAAFSPDGKRVVSGGWDKTVRLWDLDAGGIADLWSMVTRGYFRTFTGHSSVVTSVAFSPDSNRILSGSHDRTIKLWDVRTRALLRTADEKHRDSVASITVFRDGKRALSRNPPDAIKLWDLDTGAVVRTFGTSPFLGSVAVSPDGSQVLSSAKEGTLTLWDVATGVQVRTFGYSGVISSLAVSPERTRVLSGSWDSTVRLWDLSTGALLRTFWGHTDRVHSVAFSPDGKRVLSGSGDKTVKLWDTGTGALLRTFTGHTDRPLSVSVALSPDGTRVLSGGDGKDKRLMLWDASTGRLLRTFEGHSGSVFSVAFSPDGARIVSGHVHGTLNTWDVATGALLGTFKQHVDHVLSVAFSLDGARVLSGSLDGRMKLWDAKTGTLLRSFEEDLETVNTVTFSPNGAQVLSGDDSGTLRLWDVASGRLLGKYEGSSGPIYTAAFAADGRILSGDGSGVVRLWDVAKSEPLVNLVSSHDGQWLSMTPHGFFAASRRDPDMLAIVRGLEVTAIDQVHQSLFNPDLVREALAGDANGEVGEAAKLVNLSKVLESGPAPSIEITSHVADADLVKVQARVTDNGKGIGRIEWRVNGITAGVAATPEGPRPGHTLTQQMALDPGDNVIDVVAYNRSNLLASLPARITINLAGTASGIKPKLHVLAIGINKYVDRGWRPPGQSERHVFPPLALAVKDATTFGESLKRTAAQLYADVRVTTATDAEATRENLTKTIDKIAAEIQPRDTFILFAAAHGKSEAGRFYLIPQDYDGGPDPEALVARAIDQSMLQDWLANRIKAKKAVILLDTCESGALVAGYARSRTDAPASEAALGRLHEATGRPVLAAAAEGKPAFEGYEGHGVFTWSLLDALRNGDRNGNGTIELSELVAHVQDQVPKIAAKLNGRGVAAIAVRGSTGDTQSARFGSKGEDFVVTQRLH